MPEYFKLLSPIIFILYWLVYLRKYNSSVVTATTLLIVSFVAFSSNFTFIYRTLYQATQILLIVYFIYLLAKGHKSSKVILFHFIFILFVCLSLIGNPVDSDAISQTINLISISGVIGFFCINFKREYYIQVFIDFYGRLSFLVALLGILEFLIVKTLRVELTFANPNYYAFFLGAGFCATYSNRRQFLFKSKLIVILIAIFLSGSRAGLVFPLVQISWILYNERQYIKILVTVVAFSLILVNMDLDRGGATQGSDAERLAFSKIAINMALDNPYNGVGWGRFPSEFSNYNNVVIESEDGYYLDTSEDDRRVTHNDFLRILSELGIFAFISSVCYVIFTFYILLKNRGFYLDYSVPVWIGTLIFSLTHNNMNSVFFWIFLFLPWFLNKLTPRNTPRVRQT